ncbi:Bacterial extracellular solute-binding protein, family 7 [Neomoorella glycerini]|uniref:Bacterial extracellular solute-binding protein, family 7 n=1 Tax=Neomoorella glycerini TaxID=55779 RepID=A0A6I5ZTB8_9FIRM|nr:TRAP transporter substrate-binding protein [Moorella glycerini]QGP93164.1 Bacterial extracellular solute-binding protein, family 7 [Moorella glycerini]
MKKISKYFVFVILLLTLLLIILTGCGGQNTGDKGAAGKEAAAKKAVIRFSHALPEHHWMAKQMQGWADLARQKANGTLEIQIYPSAQLYKDPDVWEAVMTGGIESGHSYIFYHTRYVPEAAAMITWFLWNSTQEAYDVGLKGPLRAKIDAEMEKKGVKTLAWLPWTIEDFCFVTTKQVKVPAEMKGMTVRATVPEDIAWYKKWGVNPSNISGSELYMALQRGVIQGASAVVATSVERKLYEVAPYAVLVPCYNQFSIIGINKGFFDKLAPAQQKALVDAAQEVEGKSVAVAMKNYEEIMKKAQEVGVKVYKPTPEEMKLWTEGKDEIRQQVFKDKPQVLEEIKKLEQQLAAYRQKK